MESQLSNNIKENIKRINEEIMAAAIAAGRNPSDVILMAITKTRTPFEVNCAIEAGATLLGENKVKELCSKYDEYRKDADIHFVGHLQTNKVKQIVDKVSMIHSVDSIKLGEIINKQCMEIGKIMDVLIEVNIGSEDSKDGVAINQVIPLIESLSILPNISVKGLMAIPPICTEYEAEKYFFGISELFIDIHNKKIDNVNMKVISMGMSGDYRSAIKHGSNIVRIGTAIFGDRFYDKV